MAILTREQVDLSLHLEAHDGPGTRVGAMASGLVGSEILRIAGEVRALQKTGAAVCDLTVGDFSPKEFRIPERLLDETRRALERGETNYPPASGLPELREAVRGFYARELGLSYPVESVLVAGGARPVIYGVYRALVDPGDHVVYPVPSWNNNHYVHLVGAVGVPVTCRPESRFQPTRDDLRPHLRAARLLTLNSPLNPAGTMLDAAELAAICDLVLEENARRRGTGERPLYLMYDHIYWMLAFGGAEHCTPPGLRPEIARYTIFVDGISKAFAATGLRVGWAVGPPDVIARMSSLLGHVGAWAPRAEQAATTVLLKDPAAIQDFMGRFLQNVEARLRLLHQGLQEMKAAGLAVESIPPMGAIYLTARFHPFGRRTPDGRTLATNEDVRHYLLDAAQVAVVPFQAFGSREEDGWFRLSVGAVSLADLEAAIPRIHNALRRLS
jgi:aspartate aminotransferase